MAAKAIDCTPSNFPWTNKINSEDGFLFGLAVFGGGHFYGLCRYVSFSCRWKACSLAVEYVEHVDVEDEQKKSEVHFYDLRERWLGLLYFYFRWSSGLVAGVWAGGLPYGTK